MPTALQRFVAELAAPSATSPRLSDDDSRSIYPWPTEELCERLLAQALRPGSKHGDTSTSMQWKL